MTKFIRIRQAIIDLRLHVAAWLVGNNGMIKNVAIGKNGAGVYLKSGQTTYVSQVDIHCMKCGFFVEQQSHLIVGDRVKILPFNGEDP